eukprot:1362539-Prymnesium_polylepis.1
MPGMLPGAPPPPAAGGADDPCVLSTRSGSSSLHRTKQLLEQCGVYNRTAERTTLYRTVVGTNYRYSCTSEQLKFSHLSSGGRMHAKTAN